MSERALMELVDVRRTYHIGKGVDVPALRGVSLTFSPGMLVTIVGPSGSGKTTLLNVSGLLDHADDGEIIVGGTPTSKLNDTDRTAVRRNNIGFVFQSFNLLPHLTAEENVAMPLRYMDSGAPSRSPSELLAQVGLSHRIDHRPDQLSGGEQQRVAIARALVGDAPILLCDEPTGELDSETANEIHELLTTLRDEGKTLVVVTHNEELARIADRTIHMKDGLMVDDTYRVLGRAARVPDRTKRRSSKARSGKTAGRKPAARKGAKASQPRRRPAR
jgi:putative ABC transport system ATP-binding protein